MTTQKDRDRFGILGAKLALLGTAFFAALTGDHLIARRFLDTYEKMLRDVPIEEEEGKRAALWGELEDLACRLVANEAELAERTRALELVVRPPYHNVAAAAPIAGGLLDEIATLADRRKELEEALGALIVRLNLVSRTLRPNEP